MKYIRKLLGCADNIAQVQVLRPPSQIILSCQRAIKISSQNVFFPYIHRHLSKYCSNDMNAGYVRVDYFQIFIKFLFVSTLFRTY